MPSTEAIKRAVAAGIGVAIVSRLAIGLELETRRLKVVPLTGLSIRRPLYRVVRRGSQASKPIETFLRMIT